MFLEWPQVWIIVSAELLFVLVRFRDIQTLFKRSTQRSTKEQYQIEHGLGRGVVLECLVFVPVSAVLLLLVAPLALPENLLSPGEPRASAMYAALGIASYGFPFAIIRRIVTRIALNTLKEFAEIVPDEFADSNDDVSVGGRK